MVTERPLSPQCVGREFVRQYYTLLNEAPAHLHRFYNNNSSFIHGGRDPHNRETVVIGQRNIHQRIQQLSFRDCHTKITQVDSQATLGDGVVVQVSGELSNAGQPMRRFNQTFVLAPQNPKKYYVHNDIFRYQDMLTDEELEGEMARSEAEEDQENEPQQNDIHQPESQQSGGVGYYTGMTQVVNGTSESVHEEPIVAAPVPVPQPEPVPQQIPIAPMEMMQPRPVSPQEPAQPVVNQTPYIVNEVPQNQIEPEEHQYHNQISQQPTHQPQPQPPIETGSEPKTYATLVKSGGQIGGAPPVYYNNTAPAIIQSAPQSVSPPPVINEKPEIRQHNNQQHKPTGQGPIEQRNHFNYSAPRQQQQNSDDNGNYGGGADGDRRRTNQYENRNNTQYSDSHQLFIGNLPAGQTEEQFKTFFTRKFGAVVNVKILQKRDKKDYGFVTFEDVNTVQIVLNAKPIKYPNDNGEEINVEEKKIRRVGGGGEGGGRGGSRGGGGGVMRPVMGGGPPRGGGGPGRGMRPFNQNNRR